MDLETSDLLDFLYKQKLYRSITILKLYSESLVKEFYANLSIHTSDPTCKKFEKVYVRGHILEFSSSATSKYLNNYTSINTLPKIP